MDVQDGRVRLGLRFAVFASLRADEAGQTGLGVGGDDRGANREIGGGLPEVTGCPVVTVRGTEPISLMCRSRPEVHGCPVLESSTLPGLAVTLALEMVAFWEAISWRARADAFANSSADIESAGR